MRKEFWEIDLISYHDPAAALRVLDERTNCAAIEKPAFLALRASLTRALGDSDAADVLYKRALSQADLVLLKNPDSRLVAAMRGEIIRRQACLDMYRGQYEDALEKLLDAQTIFAAGEMRHELGLVHFNRGSVFLMEDLPNAAAAETLWALHHLRQAWKPYALHNLLVSHLLDEPTASDAEDLLAQVQASRLSDSSLRSRRTADRRQPKGRRKLDLFDARARYLQGRLNFLLGDLQLARELIHGALMDFTKIGTTVDVGLALIDLALTYLPTNYRGKWAKIRAFSAEACQCIRGMNLRATEESLVLWEMAVQKQEEKKVERYGKSLLIALARGD